MRTCAIGNFHFTQIFCQIQREIDAEHENLIGFMSQLFFFQAFILPSYKIFRLHIIKII